MSTSRRSSLTVDDPCPPKRRKRDPSSSEQLEKKAVTFCTRLALAGAVEAEAIITELVKLRKETEGIFDEEENMLQMRHKLDVQTIEQIRENQRILMRSADEAHEVEVASQATYFELEEDIRWLMSKALDPDETSVSSICENDDTGAQTELEAAEGKNIELEEKLMEFQTKFEQVTSQRSAERIADERVDVLEQKIRAVEKEKQLLEDEIAALGERLKKFEGPKG